MTSLSRSVWFAIPGDLDARTGGYGYDRRIIDGLRSRGWSVSIIRLDASFPDPTAAAREDASRQFSDLPDGAIVLVDGLAFGALPDEAAREKARLRLVALVHHPLAAETGIRPERAKALEASERRALASARLVIVTSDRTADALEAYAVPADHIVVVEPGTDRVPIARGSGGGEIALLAVASVVPRKGYETLIAALGSIRSRPWTLTCVGSLDRDRDYVARVRAQVTNLGLTDRVRFAGELDERGLAVHYDCSDVFVLPTFYEGYGMAVAEALAWGLPVVATSAGAIADMVTADAGVLVPPGDARALAQVLKDLIDRPVYRERLAHGARRVRDRLPTWERSVELMEAALRRTTRV